MTNIVIVAGGKQTRFRELSVFPKVLLPTIGHASLLSEIVSKTSDLDVKIHLVMNASYSAMVKNYIKVNNLSINVIETANTNGSFNSLGSVKRQLPKENVLFVWSDLSLSSFDQIIQRCEKCQASGIVFTFKDGKYRYKTIAYNDMFDKTAEFLSEACCVSDYSGNIPGIYFLKDLSIFKTYLKDEGKQENVDLVDVVSSTAKDLRYEVVEITDIATTLVEYRDLDVYTKIMKSAVIDNSCQTRFFNELTISKDLKRATKTAIDKDYVHLIQKEIEWYQSYEKLNDTERNERCVPKIYSSTENSMTMEWLDGYVPLHVALDKLEKDCNPSKIDALYAKLFSTVTTCMNISEKEIPLEDFKSDLKKEIVDKVIDRCDKIKDMLLNYDKNDLKEVLTKTYDELVEFAVESTDYVSKKKVIKYGFCHGDLNGSNVMVNLETNDVKFLDPRGYFGNTKLYGWKPYEVAKLLYCLYGYDDFNLKSQIYKTDWPSPRASLEYSRFRAKVGQTETYEMLLDVVGVIYVALAGYISQDVMKVNIAYEYGMKLLRRVSK